MRPALLGRTLPLPQRWRVRIAEVRAPELVVDELVRGPFARFRHEHRFADLGRRPQPADRLASTTRCRSARSAASADRLLVGRLLARTFAHRQEATRRLLRSPRAAGRARGSRRDRRRSPRPTTASGRARPTSQSTTWSS